MRAFLILALALMFLGCKLKQSNPPAATTTSAGNAFEFRPEGGSSSILGKARDRALDTKIMNEMRQVRTILEVDYSNGKGPANADQWGQVLRDLPALRVMYQKGELVAFDSVDYLRQTPGTLLLYEKRATQGDGIVSFCDGSSRRVTSPAEFNALPRPK